MRHLLVFTILACLGHVTAAHAQSLPSPQERESRIHFQRGEQLAAAGRYADAYAEFATGYELSPRPLFLFNMGECANQNSDVARARKAYLAYLQTAPTGSMADIARERVAALRNIPVGPIKPSLPSPSLRVMHDPARTPQRAHWIETPPPPLWKRWQLWTAVGALTTVVAVVILSRDSDRSPTTLDWRN